MSELSAKRPSAGRNRKTLLASAAGVVLAVALTAGEACALPTQSGALTGATVPTPANGATTETVTVSRSRAYAEWSSFNVNSGETFQVAGQTGKNWILVNKVTAGTGSTISGTVSANGQVWIIDPNGVTVNAGATLNVGGLLLSSAAWSSTDTTNFLAGGTTWSLTGASGPIVMDGTINASGGVVALIGPSVSVGGAMNDGGHSQFLAVAAKDVSLTFGDDGTYFTLDGVTIQKGADGGQAKIASGASISADRIIVASAGETSAANIVVAGGLTATQARSDGTDIVLLAADGTGPDATPTARTILSGAAVPSWSAGAGGSQGTVDLQTTGSLSAAGVSIAAGGDIALAGDLTATGQASLYSSTGGVAQTGGVVSTPTLTGSAGASLSMSGANLVGALSNFTAGGGVSFTNAQNLSVSGVNGGTGDVVLTAPSYSISINGDITAGGTITFGDAAELGADATLTGSLVKFSSTLSGAHALTITGDAEFDGAVGVGANLASLSVSGATALDGGVVSTTGVQGYAGAATLGKDATLTGSLVKFGSTLDGAQTLTITGDGEFDGEVGGASALTSVSVSRTTALSNSVKTTGTQTYTGAVTLSKDLVTLTGSAVSFGATVDGPTNLTVDTAGTTTFTGAVGGSAALASLTTQGGGLVDVNGGLVKTAGAQSFSGPVTLGADTTVSSTGGGTVGFSSTVESGFNLTVDTAGTTTLGGAATLTSLTTTGGGAVDVNGGLVKTTGAESFGGPVTLGADATVSSTAGGDIGFNSTIDGAFNLTVDTAGTTSFEGAVGGTAALASVTTAGGGAVDVNGGLVRTSGAQSFGGPVKLGADAALTSTAGGDIGFGATLDGAFNLTIDTSGTTTFPDAVGGTGALGSLTMEGGGGVEVNGGLVKTTGGQSFGGPVSFGADTTVSSTGGGTIGFSSTVDGAFNLTVDTAGTATFGGVVGGATALTSLTTEGGGAVEVSGALVKTTGAQSFGPVTLGADTTVSSTGGGDVGFNSTVDGGFNLTVDTAGITTFKDAIGGTAALGSLTTEGGGAVDVNGGLVKTTGAQSFGGAVTLGADTTVSSTGGGSIGFSSTVDGAFNLIVGTAGTTSFEDAVGGTAVLSSLTTEGGGAVDVNGGLVKTTGAQSFGGPVALGADTTFFSTGGRALGFGSTLDGAFNLIADTAGTTTFGGAVGATAALTSVTTEGGGPIDVNGGVVTTTGAQSFDGAVTLGADATLTSTAAGNIGFGATVDGAFRLGVDTSGATSFAGAVGSGAPLAGLQVSAGSISLSGSVQTSGELSLTSQAGLDINTRLSSGGGDVTLAASGGDLALGADVDAGAGTLTLSASGAVAQSGGVITAGVLTGSAGTSATLDSANAVASVSGLSAQTGLAFVNNAGFSAAGVSGGPTTSLTANTGDLTLAGDVSGTTTTLIATTGAIDQTGGIATAATLTGSAGTRAGLGDANAVTTLSSFSAPGGILFVNGAGFTATGVDGGASTSLTASTGDLTLAGNVSGTTTTLTASTGAIRQSGGVITAGTLGGLAGTSAVLADAKVQVLSGFTAAGGLSFTDGVGFTAEGVDGGTSTSLTASAGDLTLAGTVSGTTTLLTATAGDLILGGNVSSSTATFKAAGAITQTSGTVTAATLAGSAGTSASLGDANSVATLSGFSAPQGIVFVNGGGFTAEGVDGGPSTSLTASTGDLTLAGNISGTTSVTLTALTGSIAQTGGIVTAATLTGSAGAGATLTQANAVQSLSGFTATTGLAFTGAGGFSAANVDGGASASLTAVTGQLTLSGDVGGGGVALTAGGGPIDQTSGTITAGTLTGSSLGATTLAGANRIGALGAFTTYGPGADFTLVDGQTLTVTGPLTAGATAAGGAAGAAEGSISLTTTAGRLNLDGNLVAAANTSGTGGTVALVSAGGIASGDPPAIQAQDISISNQSGSVWLGDLTATRDIAVSTTTGSLTIDSASAGGNIVLRAPGDIIVQGGLSTTGAAASAGAAQTLFASDPTTLAGVAFDLSGANIDVKAGGLISVGGTTTAARDARFQAGASIAVADVTAGRDILLDAAGGPAPPPPTSPPEGDAVMGGAMSPAAAETASPTVSTGALSATGRDIAVLAESGDAAIGSASAAGNLVLRAPGDITVSGGLGATGAATSSGAAQMLFASDPSTLAGVAFNLAGANVDVKAGGAISVGGATTAASDARFQAGGSAAVADVTAGLDIVLDATGAASSTGQVTASAGALTATGRDIAVLAESGNAAIGSASAGDDVAIRAAGSVTVTGGLTAGASGGADGTGAADQLVAASASAPIAVAGTAYSSLSQGADVDVKAGWTLAGAQSPGASITVGGATAAGRDARVQATGAIGLGAAAAGQDLVADGASVAAGALSAANGDVALQASGGVQIASASAGDAIAISSGGVTSVSGALSAAGAGGGDSRPRAGDALADAVLGLASGQITGDVAIAATNVQLGSVSAPNGDVLMFARPGAGAAGVTYLGGTAARGARGGFDLDQAEIAAIRAHSLDVFAGLAAAGAGDVSIGALNLPQGLPTLRVYTGGASRVDVLGPLTGATGSSLVIGDSQIRSALNAPSAAVLALSQGWTPKVIRVEGTIGGLGAGQAFDQVSLSAQSLYIAPVESGLDFETAVQTTRPEGLPVYAGALTYQIAAANLQLSAAGPGVIYERNLARNPADLSAGVGLSVGKLTIDTVAPSDAPPGQIALFGTLSPQGVALAGPTAALGLTFPAQSGPAAPVLFTPAATVADLYKFNGCVFGGGACFVTVPPVNVNPVPVPNLVGDVSDPYAPIDEEPVTSSGGEIAWPTSNARPQH